MRHRHSVVIIVLNIFYIPYLRMWSWYQGQQVPHVVLHTGSTWDSIVRNSHLRYRYSHNNRITWNHTVHRHMVLVEIPAHRKNTASST